MDFQINPIREMPIEDAKLLGHEKIVANLKTFLENENMITPLSIAIHGEWGSGKTSIMKTLEKNLDNSKFEVLFFEAWKYEYSNPSLGLITEIAEKYATGNLTKDIIRAGAYILAQKYLGVNPEEVLKNIRASKAHSETLSEKLRKVVEDKIGNKKLIIIIDDLDRCDVENSLQLLAITKLFFDLENCVCIAAVDFKRLRQAWRQKYQIDKTSDDDGSQYLDKIFQIQIGIPKPPVEQVKEYVETLIEQIPNSVSELLANILPKNPRSIKRILNLISYRQNILQSDNKEISAIFWTLLEEIISNSKIIYLHDLLKKNGASIGHFILQGNDWATVKKYVQNHLGNDFYTKHATRLSMFFALSYNICVENNITKNEIDDDFVILYSATNEALR